MDAMIRRIIGFRALKFDKGELSLWNIKGILTPLSMNSYLWKLLEEKCGKKEAMNILFSWGREQGLHTYNVMAKKFGFVKTKSREELLKFILEQSSLIGHGYFRWSKIDFKNNVLIGRGISFMAQNYKKIFGLQKCPIDYFLRGEVTSLASEIFNKNMFCVEMECIAVGNKECVFVAKPLNRWDRNDSQFRNQLVNKLPSIKELANLKTVPL